MITKENGEVLVSEGKTLVFEKKMRRKLLAFKYKMDNKEFFVKINEAIEKGFAEQRITEAGRRIILLQDIRAIVKL